MPIPPDLPVVDHHCHLSASGDGVAAARRFAAAGGSHLFLATQQYGANPPRSLPEYVAQFEETERLARLVQAEAGVVAYAVVAPYPVDLVGQVDELGATAACALQEAALDVAGRWVQEHRAVALGEVGRPHFPVDEAVAGAADRVFRHALGVARDVGCPAVVHSEELDADGYARLATLASQESFPVDRLVKHYARSVLSSREPTGVVPSYLAQRGTFRDALERPGPWLLETDYLDDPRRPGAVLDLATIPRRAESLLRGGAGAAERLRVPFEASVERVYGFRPTVDRSARR